MSPSFTIQGLLTVDPKKRLTINEVMNCSWLMPKNRESSFGFPSLMTPGILSIRSFPKATELAVKQTIDAFHMAAREGFRLQVKRKNQVPVNLFLVDFHISILNRMCAMQDWPNAAKQNGRLMTLGAFPLPAVSHLVLQV